MTVGQTNVAMDSADDRTVVIARIFDAPRALVFKMFTTPEHLAQWWGPKGWTLPVCRMDFRPGGVWHYCMRGPNGEESWGKAVYQEVVEPERIVYLDTFSNAEGTAVAGMPEILATVIFTEHEGRTKLTNRAQFASAKEVESVLEMGMVQGLTETWDRLEAYLATA